jgi:hypothetical protein
MRVNLIAQDIARWTPSRAAVPLRLTIRPACGLPGEYQYSTDSVTLLTMLRHKTDLPDTVITQFAAKLYDSMDSRLLSVELSERTLTDIGYFID